jgi:hypothetical protein
MLTNMTARTPMKLPYDVVDVLLAYAYDPDVLRAHVFCLREAGWTLESIASPLGMSRERVRQIANLVYDFDSARRESQANGLVVPAAPVREKKERKESVPRPRPTSENLSRLLELQPLVQQVRANSPKYRVEAEEYTSLIAKEHNERGVSLYRLAKELGVTHGALRFRLVRYGYKQTESESRVYKPIVQANRV